MSIFLLILLFAFMQPIQAQEESNPEQGLDIHTVLTLVESRNPEIKAAERVIESAGIRKRMESFWPNPEFEIESENFGNSDSFSGFESAETSVLFSQSLPIWGSRQAREARADKEIAISRLRHQLLVHQLRGEAAQRFVVALSARNKLKIQNEIQIIFEQLLTAMTRMEQAGRLAPLDLRRARLEYNTFLLSLSSAKREKTKAFQELSSLWTDEQLAVHSLRGDFAQVTDMPALEIYLQKLTESPAWKLMGLQTEAGEADIQVAQSERYPVISTTLGIKHHHELGETAFVFGAGVELPIFNGHSTDVELARSQLRTTAAEIGARKLRIRSEVIKDYQELISARDMIRQFESTIINEAERVLEDVIKGYRAGKFSLMDVIDVQRTLLASRQEYINALADFHKIHIRLYSLVGFPGGGDVPNAISLVAGDKNE